MPHTPSKKPRNTIAAGVKGYALDALDHLWPLVPLAIVIILFAAVLTVLWVFAGGNPADIPVPWRFASYSITALILAGAFLYLWTTGPRKLAARGQRLEADRMRAKKVKQARSALAARGAYTDPERNSIEGRRPHD